jgi:hypothetical protein
MPTCQTLRFINAILEPAVSGKHSFASENKKWIAAQRWKPFYKAMHKTGTLSFKALPM